MEACNSPGGPEATTAEIRSRASGRPRPEAPCSRQGGGRKRSRPGVPARGTGRSPGLSPRGKRWSGDDSAHAAALSGGRGGGGAAAAPPGCRMEDEASGEEEEEAFVSEESDGRQTEDGEAAVSGDAERRSVQQVSGAVAVGGRSWSGVPRGFVASGEAVISDLIRNSVTEVTWCRYAKVWAEWEELLCLMFGGESVDYLVALLSLVSTDFSAGRSASAVAHRVSAVAFWLKMRGERDVSQDFRVRQALRGFRRGVRERDKRRPVSFGLLRRMVGGLSGICESVYETVLFTTAFGLAFYGAFRIGELVSPSRVTGGGLMFEDVQVSSSQVECRIRRSKMDQLGRGRLVVLYAVPGEELCPVRLVERFMAVRGGLPGPLLRHLNGSFLSRFQFVAVLRLSLCNAGERPEEFGSHSFRIGAATEAARWGLGDEVVKRIGRWESSCFRRYVRPQLL
ncbi:uncharacterized protein ACNLHF_023442 [Anomaloglossus baeobatrachus]